MIFVNTYFFKEKAKTKGTSKLYISLVKNNKRALILLNVELRADQWDGKEVQNHPNKKTLNLYIQEKRLQIEKSIMMLEMTEQTNDKTIQEIAELVKEELDPDYKRKRQQQNDEKLRFMNHYKLFTESKSNPGTRAVYECTLRQLQRFIKDNPDFENLQLQDFTKQWLESFEEYCLKTERRNTVSIHMRNIRAAFNAAIDKGLCQNYPFRKFRIKQELSTDKSMNSDDLKRLFNAETNNDGERTAVDIFQLAFYLIGINPVDLFNAPVPEKGRLNYTRAKTGKKYTIKIEPEAQNIINKYAGKTHLLRFCEQYQNYKTFFHRISISLKKIGLKNIAGKKSKGHPLFPKICFGSARTSWATIAQEELDISKDIIAAALGHHTIDVTTTYLRTDWKKKIDAANRKMLDYIFETNKLIIT